VIGAITKTPWAITADGLELVIGIAERKISDPEAVALASDARKNSGNLSITEDGVAILNVAGTIFPHASLFTKISGATSIDTLNENFTQALEDTSVKAILLNIDSPGGKITGIHEFAEKIYNARGIKPIQAYVSALGASAAYWIATAADKIFIDKTAMVGSIGVIAAWTDDTKAKESFGIQDYQVVSSKSPNKNVDAKTQKGKELLLKELDALADVFISDVARNRNVSVEKVETDFGQGGILVGSDAVNAGMADGLNSFEGIIKKLSLIQIGDSSMSAEKKESLIEAATEAEYLSSNSLENNSPPTPSKTATLDEAKANLLAQNPKLYSAIKEEGFQSGILSERERIKAIESIGVTFTNKDLIEDAKFSNPRSAEKLAFELIKSENEAIKKYAADYAEDAKDVNGVSASVDTQTGEDSDIKAMVAGAMGVIKNG